MTSLDSSLDITIVEDAVKFVFTVKNAGDRPIGLEFDSGKTADVAVYKDDVEVWRWSDGRMFTQAVEEKILEYCHVIEQRFSWDDPPPGEYVAVATLEDANGVEEREELTI